MAGSRSQVDSSVKERRLRPIYDCLDNGNNKKAIVEADKVLKKEKDSQCAKVLKALALIRLQRHEESIQILAEVHHQSPTDDATLQAMSICYREVRRPDLLANAYERAIAKDPTNEELMSHLFMAYVRLCDYKKQQQTATQLYKLKPKNPYYFWSVMSLYMQAVTEKDQSLAEKMFLPLAEKKTKKFADEGKIEAEAEVELYLMILEKQKKYNEMLEVLAGPLANLLKNHLSFLTRRRADVLEALNRPEEALDTYKGLIDSHPDQYEYFEKMFSLTVQLDAGKTNEDECLMKQLISFTNKSTERSCKKGSKSKLRAPFLAKIMFYYQLKSKKCDHPLKEIMSKLITSNIVELFTAYYSNFGNKLAFNSDIQFVMKNHPESSNDVYEAVAAISQTRNFNDYPTNPDELYLFYNYYALWSQRPEISRQEKFDCIVKLINCYQVCLNFAPEAMTSEIQPADYFLVLAVDLLTDGIPQDSSLILIIIKLLEAALQKCPCDHFLKLILINLYNYIGASKSSVAYYESLDIKHLQQDGLGYLIYAPLYLSGHFNKIAQLYHHALRFYTSNLKDTNDYIIYCYKYGSFNKVEEILELKERVSSSLQFNMFGCEKMIVDVMIEASSQEVAKEMINFFDANSEEERDEKEIYYDNSDVEVFHVLGSSIRTNIAQNKEKAYKANLLWFRMRHEMIKCIAKYYECDGSSSVEKITDSMDKASLNGENGTPEKRLEAIERSLNRIDEIWKQSEVADIVLSKDQESIIGFTSTRLETYRRLPCYELLSSAFRFVHAILVKVEAHDDKTSMDPTNVLKALDKLEEQFKASTKITSIVDCRGAFENYVNFVDTISLCVVVLGIVSTVIKGQSSNGKKKKKQQQQQPQTQEPLLFLGYRQTVDRFIKTVESLMISLEALNVSDLATIAPDHHIVKAVADLDCWKRSPLVSEKIESSYKESKSEIRNILTAKHKYLKSLAP